MALRTLPMPRHLLILFVAAALLLPAQTRLTVAQLVEFVSSSVKLKQSDKQVAAYLRTLKLTEKLDPRVVEELQAMGAGARTAEALQALAEGSFNLPAPPTVKREVLQPLLAPELAEQGRILDEVREYALTYTKGLPNFLCVQVTRRFADPNGVEFWRLMDTVTTKLSYFEQKEKYDVILVNNRPTSLGLEQLGGTTSTGEFGTLMRQVFELESRTQFRWERWATLRGRRMHVFSYRVPKETSQWTVAYERTHQVTPGYRGLVYVDRDTLAVMRISLEAENLPTSFPVQQAGTVLDYDVTEIAGEGHILPLKATTRMRSARVLTKNETEFRLYRRFGSDVSVSFAPDPLPDEKTTEQPPK